MLCTEGANELSKTLGVGIAMSEDNESKSNKLDCGYFGEIAIIIFFGVILWSVCGMLSGYEVFTIHEWGGAWFIAIIFGLPVVVAIAVIAAIFVPKLAAKRDYHSPRWLAKITVSLWILIAFLITLAIFLHSMLNYGSLRFMVYPLQR